MMRSKSRPRVMSLIPTTSSAVSLVLVEGVEAIVGWGATGEVWGSVRRGDNSPPLLLSNGSCWVERLVSDTVVVCDSGAGEVVGVVIVGGAVVACGGGAAATMDCCSVWI